MEQDYHPNWLNRNKFLRKLVLEILSKIAPSVDISRIESVLKSHNFRINAALLHSLSELQATASSTVISEDDNDFLPFVQEEDGKNPIDTLLENELDEVQQSDYFFSKIKNSPFYDWLQNDDVEISKGIKVIFEKALYLHNTATRGYLDLVSQFLTLFIEILDERRVDLHRIFVLSSAAEDLIFLCFSFNDAVRANAIKLLYSLAKFDRRRTTLSMESRELGLVASALYLANFEVNEWLEAIEKYTFATFELNLSQEEALAITKAFEAFSFMRDSLLEVHHKQLLQGLEARIQNVLVEKFAGKSFVKLSTRSPKDVPFKLPKYHQMVKETTTLWTEKYLKAREGEDLPDSIRQAISQTCAAACMCVTSGAEALDLLQLSEKVYFDLKQALDLSSNFTMKLVFRAWHELPIHFELRGFVRGRQLNGLSQYFTGCYFPFISLEEWKEVKERVLKFYEQEIRGILPVEHCVVDFVVCPDRVMIVELNPFGGIAGSALFSWEKDQETLYHGPFQFRVIGDAQLTVISV